MTNREFYSIFSSEAVCRTHFQQMRLKHGVKCKKCSCIDHYWLPSKEQFECKECSFRTTLRSGTLLESSKLPFMKWYEAFHLLSMSKKPISARTLERHLEVHYETAWYMLQKIRIAMGSRNRDYHLEGLLEVDETQITVMDLSSEENDEGNGKKKGRGAAKAKVLVMTSFSESNNPKSRSGRTLKYVAMEILDSFSTASIKSVMTKWIKKHSRIYTDGFSSYSSIQSEFTQLTQHVASGAQAAIKLPIVHTIIGNLKNAIKGIHHSISLLHLQNYLDEFCYKTNRRNTTSRLMESIAMQSVRFSW